MKVCANVCMRDVCDGQTDGQKAQSIVAGKMYPTTCVGWTEDHLGRFGLIVQCLRPRQHSIGYMGEWRRDLSRSLT